MESFYLQLDTNWQGILKSALYIYKVGVNFINWGIYYCTKRGVRKNDELYENSIVVENRKNYIFITFLPFFSIFENIVRNSPDLYNSMFICWTHVAFTNLIVAFFFPHYPRKNEYLF